MSGSFQDAVPKLRSSGGLEVRIGLTLEVEESARG